MGRNSFLLFSPLGKRNYESLAKFIETGEFEEYQEPESDFEDEDEIEFDDFGSEQENAEKMEEGNDEAEVVEEIKRKEESDDETEGFDERKEKNHDEL